MAAAQQLDAGARANGSKLLMGPRRGSVDAPRAGTAAQRSVGAPWHPGLLLLFHSSGGASFSSSVPGDAFLCGAGFGVGSLFQLLPLVEFGARLSL